MFLSAVHTKKGFTLIELLVVISIISLLSSIVMASLSSARNKAQSTKVMQEIRQFQIALEQYNAQNGKYPLLPVNTYARTSSGYESERDGFALIMSPYINTKALSFMNPAMNFHFNYPDGGNYKCGTDALPSYPTGYSVIFYTPGMPGLSLPDIKTFDAWSGSAVYSCFISI